MASFKWPSAEASSTNEFSSIKLDGATSGTLTLQAAAVTTDYTITFPGAQGASGQTLVNNGSGALSWSDAAAITIGTINSQTAVANGLQLIGDVLYAQYATGAVPGMVSTAAQTLAGAKTFSTAPILSSLSASLPLQLDASKNITAAAIDLSGTQATGTLAAGRFPALTGDLTTSAGALATTLATVNSNVGSFTHASITVNGKGLVTAASSGTAPVTTLAAVGSSPNANAATLSGNTLNLEPASASFPGVVTTGAQTLAGAKTFSTAPIITALSASLPLQLDGSKNMTAIAIDLSGSQATGVLAAASFPALTGAITTVAGALATTYAGTVPLNKGGTGQTTKAAAFDALQPMSAIGQLIYGGTSGTGTALSAGSSTALLTCNGGAAPSWVLPAYYCGYLKAGSDWSTSSATFADPTGGASITLTDILSTNMGTVVAAGSSKAGITVTLPVTGVYWVGATISATSVGGAADLSYRIVDGSSVVINAGLTIRSPGNYECMSLSGLYSGTAGSVTFLIQAAASANSNHISNAAASGPAIQWTVYLVR